jgi:hypothetical protein
MRIRRGFPILLAAVTAAFLVAGTCACGWTTDAGEVACGRLEQAECDAAVSLATLQLPPAHPSIKRIAADFLCAPGNPCQAGFKVAVAFDFGTGGDTFAVLVSGVQGAEHAVPLEGVVPAHVLSLLQD